MLGFQIFVVWVLGSTQSSSDHKIFSDLFGQFRSSGLGGGVGCGIV